jgi:hypothetical protein
MSSFTTGSWSGSGGETRTPPMASTRAAMSSMSISAYPSMGTWNSSSMVPARVSTPSKA